MTYQEFLNKKIKRHVPSGFDIDESELNTKLFDFQKFTVQRALRAGKYAIFADTGQGKTPMQLDIAYQVVKKTQRPALILAPLAVTGQTIEQGDYFNISVSRLNGHVENKIYIANYEQLHNINANEFGCICLDESSILKNESGKYRNYLIESFLHTPYKFCFSATPSPNDPMELGNHAEFLDVMSYEEMLAMYFVHDSSNTSKWRLKGHAISKFYEFVSNWAIMYSHPRDIGFENNDFDLPELEIIDRMVKTPVPAGVLFSGAAVSATDYNSSLRETQQQRIDETIAILKEMPESEQVIIWTKQNPEASEIYKQLSHLGYDCRNVQGSDSNEKKEKDLLGFSHNEYRILITKQTIASKGLNYQNCGYQIFNSVDFSFELTYQAIRRSWRYGRKEKVTCYMVTTDRMLNVVKTQKEKHEQFKLMQERMSIAVSKNLNKNITTMIKGNEKLKMPIWL